jgi:hypothetical protein
MEDDDRPARRSRKDFSTAISGYLERNLYASCHEVVKDLFVLITTISQVWHEIGSRFFIARMSSPRTIG